MKKICVVTGTRAEYGLLYWVMKAIQNEPDLELQILATGMHLSPEYGLTVNQIEQDGFQVNKKVEMLLSSNTKVGMAKSTSLAISGMADAFSDLHPDLVLVLGDRFEIFAAASTCMLLNLPLAHCHGGESTFGLIDEPIRHSITKMSHLHFVSTDKYKKRVAQMGESPDKIFNVGALGIESINKMSFMTRLELENSLEFKFGEKNLLVTFHPVTLEGNPTTQIGEVLTALEKFKDVHIIFTLPNADAGSHEITDAIKAFATKHKERAKCFTSLGQRRYLSVMKQVDAVLGNSSSGIVEAPALKKPTIDIGIRQAGRICADSVLKCQPLSGEIAKTISVALSPDFQEKCKKIINPYGTGNSAEKIIKILKSINLDHLLVKEFNDVEFSL